MTEFLSKLTASVETYMGRDALSWLAEEAGEGTDALGTRALARLHRREIEHQRNLERIVELASEELQEDVSSDAVAADWLALYFDLAQDVEQDPAQRLWARLLALQVAVPDAVYKRTLVHLHRMEQWEVEAFAEYCSFAFAFESGWRFVFDEALTRQEIWGYVRGNDYTQHFINIGLLAPELAPLAAAQSKGLLIRYYEKQYELMGQPPASTDDPQEPAQVGYRRFTVAGQQLTKAIRAKTYYGYARNVIKALECERRVEFRPVEDDADGPPAEPAA
jgi:hypothetical protein